TCRVVTYGCDGPADWRVRLGHDQHGLQRFSVAHDGPETSAALPFPGRHNALNAAAAMVLAEDAGASRQACVEACSTFRGPARRFEIAGDVGGVTVVDDYAHHPTEVMV